MSIYQASVRMHLGAAVQMRNVLHYEFPGYVPTESELSDATDALSAAYKTYFQNKWATAVGFDAVEWRRVDIGDQPSLIDVPAGGPWAGASADNKLPNAVGLLVTGRAFASYPRTVRSYIGGFVESTNSAGGTPDAGTQTDGANWALATVSLAITGQSDAGRVAVSYGGDPRVVVAYNPITQFAVASEWAYQRRRKAGVGI